MVRDRDPNHPSGFISLVGSFVSEVPFTAALFTVSLPFILLGTIFDAGWLLLSGMLGSFTALLTGMFLE